MEWIETLLERVIAQDYIRNWEALKHIDPFAERLPTRAILQAPVLTDLPQPPNESEFVFSPTFRQRMMPFLKNRELARLARSKAVRMVACQQEVDRIKETNDLEQTRVEAKRQKEEERFQQAIKAWELRKADFVSEQQRHNQQIDEQRGRYLACEPDALVSYWYDLFSEQAQPEGWPEGCLLQYLPETKTLVIDYELPAIESLPTIKEIRYVATRNEFKESLIPDTQRKRTYDDTNYRITLASLYKLFQSDVVDALATVIFNGWVQSVDRATGAPIHPCIVSIQVQKSEFLNLNLAHVDPRMCFKKLKSVSGSRLADMSPVQPVLSLNRQDPRFVDGYTVVESLTDATNLAAMDWLDFENLIRELFEKEFSQNGGEVKITQASRDGGVDAVAFDPDPIRGGKIVIQAKRYTNAVGVSAVRDLYGTVHNEGATKGILVTTSDFGPDAYEFAKGKPLTLLSGSELLYLLQRHGYRARIDLADAKRQWLASGLVKQSESSSRVN